MAKSPAPSFPALTSPGPAASSRGGRTTTASRAIACSWSTTTPRGTRTTSTRCGAIRSATSAWTSSAPIGGTSTSARGMRSAEPGRASTFFATKGDTPMKAIRVREFGGPEVLRIEEVPTPRPRPGQVLVRVKAAGVNPYDTYMRAGTYAIKPPLPYTPGSDASGRSNRRRGRHQLGRRSRLHRQHADRRLRPVRAGPGVAGPSPAGAALPSPRAPASGCRTAPRITPCATSPTPAAARPCSSTGPAAASASPRCRSPARWASSSSARPGRPGPRPRAWREGTHQVFDHRQPGYQEAIRGAPPGAALTSSWRCSPTSISAPT